MSFDIIRLLPDSATNGDLWKGDCKFCLSTMMSTPANPLFVRAWIAKFVLSGKDVSNENSPFSSL